MVLQNYCTSRMITEFICGPREGSNLGTYTRTQQEQHFDRVKLAIQAKHPCTMFIQSFLTYSARWIIDYDGVVSTVGWGAPTPVRIDERGEGGWGAGILEAWVVAVRAFIICN